MPGCHYCGYHEGGHSVDCPTVAGEAAMKIWQGGWNAGREGNPRGKNPNKYFQLGWLRGEVALEEFENGDPGW